MTETKRMHYVPRTYLKHFAKKATSKGGKDIYLIHGLPVGIIDKNRIKEMNIKEICFEKDIYALPGSTLEERQLLENMYKKLYEDDYDALHQLLTQSNKEILTSEERYSIISFVVSMFFRNNFWQNFLGKVTDDIFEKGYNATKANEKDSFFIEDKEISIVGKSLEQLQKEIRQQDRHMVALMQAKKMFELIRMRLLNDVVTLVKLIDNDYEFTTSDNPVSARNPSGLRVIPMDPSNILSIPIDSKHLLQLRPLGSEIDIQLLGRINANPLIAKAQTTLTNGLQAGQAGRFILGSYSALSKFADSQN